MFGYFRHDTCRCLERNDFFRFTREFEKVVFANIPTIKELEFVDPPISLPALPLEDPGAGELYKAMERAVKSETSVVFQDTLILPFKTSDGAVVAKVSGLDDYLLRKVGKDWLDGLGLLLSREFMLVKRSCVDSLTGLLSSLYLEESLDSLVADTEGLIVLVSLYPKGGSAFQAKKYQHKNISLLKRFLENRFPLYYLGQSCFALVIEDQGADFIAEFAPAFVNFLKRERCVRVHVASVPFSTVSESSSASFSDTLMQKAWMALHVASRRGPFAFCNYDSIEGAAHHPLAVSEKSVVRWFRKQSRSCGRFGLLQFDSKSEVLLACIQAVMEKHASLFSDDCSFYLFLPEKDSKHCLEIGKEILGALKEKQKTEETVHRCGISSFPFSVTSIGKRDILLNCRKALCHAAFLTSGSLVICDAVSFNISGDIYYGDGDLVLAVKEYKRGLSLDPANGNLLNSLGVCYAQMNRHSLAVDCFQKACKSEDDKFMALYNLGIEQQIKNENQGAMASFCEALKSEEKEGEEKARQDMRFQLGVLSLQGNLHKQALDYLVPWYSTQQKRGSADKGLRFLGEAYYGVGMFRDAMKYLQQALRFDEYDAEVLSLLGEVYLRENEGDDIGLRLCEKAVELNPDSLILKVRLAGAQIKCGDFHSAGKNLQSALRSKKSRPAALVQKGLLAREAGEFHDAEKWLLKVESCSDRDLKAETDARSYLKKWKTQRINNG